MLPEAILNLKGCVGVFVTPDVPGPRHCIGSVLCPACAVAPDRRDKLQTAFRKLWPTGRVIDVPRHAPGHA